MIYAGILAGGTGTRMGISNLPKQFLELGDRPILIHTIEKFVLEPSIERIVVGVLGDWVAHAEDLVSLSPKVVQIEILVLKRSSKPLMLTVQSQKMISWSLMTLFVLLSHFE